MTWKTPLQTKIKHTADIILLCLRLPVSTTDGLIHNYYKGWIHSFMLSNETQCITTWGCKLFNRMIMCIFFLFCLPFRNCGRYKICTIFPDCPVQEVLFAYTFDFYSTLSKNNNCEMCVEVTETSFIDIFHSSVILAWAMMPWRSIDLVIECIQFKWIAVEFSSLGKYILIHF